MKKNKYIMLLIIVIIICIYMIDIYINHTKKINKKIY